MCCSSQCLANSQRVLFLVQCWPNVLHLLFPAQDCLMGLSGAQIPFRDLGGGRDSIRVPTGSQAIVTSYQFHCCGEITQWQTYMEPGGNGHREGVYSVNFQVWRPSPTSGSGGDCYSLVGENRFPGITLGSGGLVSETPEPTNMISVRPGDVLGYFVTSTRSEDNQGIQMDPDIAGDVFYADVPLSLGPDACPMSVGPGGVLDLFVSAAPVISVEISKCQHT